MPYYIYVQWRRGGGGERQGDNCPPHLNFSVSVYLVLGRSVFQKYKLGLKHSILGEFSSKVKILSTRNVFCRKFATFWPC